jgi:hypothetical protein
MTPRRLPVRTLSDPVEALPKTCGVAYRDTYEPNSKQTKPHILRSWASHAYGAPSIQLEFR